MRQEKYKQTGGRQTYIQTYRWADRQRDRDIQTGRHPDIQTGRQTETYRHTDRQTDRQTNIYKYIPTYILHIHTHTQSSIFQLTYLWRSS